MPEETTETPQRIERPTVPELDAILGTPFPVLDDGFVRLVDYMGNDASVVQAARVSYGEGTKQIHEDRGLIRYLMRHWHTTPFEMCDIKLHVRAPMDCWRQWIRHRTASVNEYSTRYSVAIDAAQRTDPGAWRAQATTNKQGSAGTLPRNLGVGLTAREGAVQRHAQEEYESRIKNGVAREQARKDLPLSTYTEAYWKCNLHNLLHFLRLRMDEHAQQEIREYATIIGEQIVARWVPHTWEAFRDYRLEALQLTRIEHDLMQALQGEDYERAHRIAKGAGWLKRKDDGNLKGDRERNECDAKFTELGLEPSTFPWTDVE